MKTFKTPKGTELPLMDLQGKDYLQVAHRLVWFREEKSDWAIETEVLAELQLVRAVIKDATGRIMATAHKAIGAKRFPVESSETGAVGRALAMCGFGTAHCGDELEEGEDIADAPIEPRKPLSPAEANHYSKMANGAQPDSVRTQTAVVNKLPTTPGVSLLSEKQLKRLYAISKKTGWKPDRVKAYLGSMGLEKAEQMNFIQYNKLVENMEAYPEPGSEALQ